MKLYMFRRMIECIILKVSFVATGLAPPPCFVSHVPAPDARSLVCDQLVPIIKSLCRFEDMCDS